MFASKDDKPYSTTFGQISSKSNEEFSNYGQKTSFFDTNPYNLRIEIFFKKTKTSHSSDNLCTPGLPRGIFLCWSLGFEAYMGSRSSVRASVRPSHHIWRSAHQIFMIFCTKLYLDKTKKCSKRIFEKNSRF